MHNQINIKTAYRDNGAIVAYYITQAFWCFDLLLVDEGFQLISKANSTHITSHQLTTVKSAIKTNQYEGIMMYGLMSDELGRLKLLGKFYQKMKLNLPIIKALKRKIKELVRVMYVGLLRKVMEVDGLGKGWAEHVGEGERDDVGEWMDEVGMECRTTRASQSMKKLHQKGRKLELVRQLQLGMSPQLIRNDEQLLRAIDQLSGCDARSARELCEWAQHSPSLEGPMRNRLRCLSKLHAPRT